MDLLEVRPPRQEEFDAVLDLRYRVLDEPMSLPRKVEPGKHDLDPRNIHMAAFIGDSLVSTVRVDMHGQDDTFLVRRMATDPLLQGHGIGSRVMQAAECEVMERGGKNIILHARQKAVTFYERLGYVLTGQVEIHNGDPNPEMVKKL